MKVAAAEGHDDVADRMLNDDVFNRTDDYLPPIDPPKRTSEVARRKGWEGPKQRP